MSTAAPAPTPTKDAPLPVANDSGSAARGPVIALVGNPNSGKTSLFNRLTGLRAQTANFAGTTVEHRRGRVRIAGHSAELIDLPGLYSLDATTPDERVARQVVVGEGPVKPDALVLVIDATNLERNLFLASQLIEASRSTERPMLVALNMMDLATKHGVHIDRKKLEHDLGCPVLPVSARSGEGFSELNSAIGKLVGSPVGLPVQTQCACSGCAGCAFSRRYDWAESVARRAAGDPSVTLGRTTEKIDRFLTHRVVGLIGFAAVMFATFWTIYSLASYPMDWIEGLTASAGDLLGRWLPAGDFRSLIVDGIIGGVGGMLVFLPQICILFFMLSLLEDSGYLARAAFVMDRLMQRVGLPGKAFVPMLSAHACAIPAIMSTRVIEDRRDRLATILVLPLMTCSARVPVYALVIALLFSNSPVMAATVFTAAYALGIVAALAMAWLFKRTLLPGETRPLVIELPNYRLPSLRNALLQTYDRATVFIKNAGTTILLITFVLWAASTYPKTSFEDLTAEQQTTIIQLEEVGDTETAEHLMAEYSLEGSITGHIGQTIEPVFAPLGFDWKMSIGVVSSFAAREVIVSTLSVLYGLGDEVDHDQTATLTDRLRHSTHTDGTKVFSTAACLSLLVFYVLAMQCLPTQVVTKRETGSWRWTAFQFGYMTVLAYGAALVTYQTAAAFGLG
ncbi:ferrous iron transport protein B [Aeoliella sp. ICT_H6.2]|uniref:Ferrous iron transport protein B n=1 Tax=Aeoliella straminimaris TaxID=2954799 RepID=A0A9X2JKQ4_9BACT|nr:ferrous iron transport protein B [Aeoliella straminimaris]MCO6047114.1 ferrous iron transport protein B [Aeoliella straminimaris]